MDRFEHEISLIESRKLKLFVQMCIEYAPAYFWTIPSSTTGNHHPADENVVGGQVLHTKRVVNIADNLCESLSVKGIERDCVIAAAIMHDLCKRGYPDDTGHTVTGHGYLWNELVRKAYTKNDILDDRNFKVISRLILFHMGKYDPPYYIDTNDKLALIVHLSDYISALKNVTVGV